MLVLQQTLLLLWFCNSSNAHHGSVVSRDGISGGHGGRLKLLRFAVGRGTLIISREGACVCEHHHKTRWGRGQGLICVLAVTTAQVSDKNKMEWCGGEALIVTYRRLPPPTITYYVPYPHVIISLYTQVAQYSNMALRTST
jgi:hypothetical protein